MEIFFPGFLQQQQRVPHAIREPMIRATSIRLLKLA